MKQRTETWCDRDEHKLFEHFNDFNQWLDNGEEDAALAIRIESGINNFSHPSKAFYAGDKEAYEQAFKIYRLQRRHQVLSMAYLTETFAGNHWYIRNEQRFNQLVECLIDDSVVPFIGAGVSVAGGFPTWKDHLRQQGRTAGLKPEELESQLSKGKFEAVIEKIERTRGRDVFTQEIRDVFSRTGSLENITLRLTELFSDTLITTNYDRLLEQAFDTGSSIEVQIINGINAMEQPDPKKTTVIKLHGDIKSPQRCILSKNQYDDAYGEHALDLKRPIPKLLEYYFKNSNLLFVGCSLHNDRTIQVFEAIKQAIGDQDLPQHFSIEQTPTTEDALVTRNAELARLGITAIWYEKGQYDLVEAILRHARSEVIYKKGTTQVLPNLTSETITNPNVADRLKNWFFSTMNAFRR